MKQEIKVGDYVRLVRGKQRQVVIEVGVGKIRAQYPSILDYDSSGLAVRWRPVTDYVLFQEEEKEEMAKLYEMKDESGKALFGTLLARNSAGQLVLEIKGTGEVRAVDVKDATEVKPYTVAIKHASLERQSGTISHYQSKPGALAKGDIVMFSDGNLGVVKSIDTKNDTFQSLKNARKVITEPLEELGPGTETEEV